MKSDKSKRTKSSFPPSLSRAIAKGEEESLLSSPSLHESLVYNVAVIGGGSAGMIAAGRAGEIGARVVLVEKNKKLGRKLLLTGKGRCNITNKAESPREFINKFGKNGDFLFSSFSRFGIEETIEFFEKKGLKTKIERGKRVFPKSDKSQDVLNVLISYLKRNGVKIMTNYEVKEIIKDPSFAEAAADKKNRIAKIILNNGEEIVAKNYIFATGGKSYPGTGSTGDGYKWAEKLGHKINKLRPALVPLKIKENWPKSVRGLALKNIKLTVFGESHKQDSRFGELLFTHFGISGPIVLDLSHAIGELLERGEVKLVLDLKPALDFQTLDKRLLSDFSKYSKKLFKNSLSDLLPQKLIPIVVDLSGISPSKKVNEITREERHKLVKLLKGLEMTVSSLLGFETAIVTSGGVSLREIDSKTMKSKLIENLYFSGEVIDLHGPTGGYNLQLCWTTGYVAGESVF